jgi:hypothetical protein
LRSLRGNLREKQTPQPVGHVLWDVSRYRRLQVLEQNKKERAKTIIIMDKLKGDGGLPYQKRWTCCGHGCKLPWQKDSALSCTAWICILCAWLASKAGCWSSWPTQSRHGIQAVLPI